MNINAFLKKQFDYWREMILFLNAIFFYILAFTIPYLLWQLSVPPALTLILSVILSPSCIVVAFTTMRFMKSVPVGDWWAGLGWIPQGPATLSGIMADLSYFYRKYRKFIWIDAAANCIYFICLAAYFLGTDNQLYQALSSERAGASILIFWIIMNCLIMIIACVALIFASRENTEEHIGRDWRP